MDLFKNDINFVTDDLKGFIEKNDLPETKVKNSTSRIKYDLLLGFKEKDEFVELMVLNWNQLIEKINLLQMNWESAF